MICTPFGLVTPTSASRPLPALLSTSVFYSLPPTLYEKGNDAITYPIHADSSKEESQAKGKEWHSSYHT